MKTKLIKTLALVAGLAAGSPALADGNIYEIVPCTQTGAALSGPIASVRNPLVAGETVYFKLRMPRTQAMKAAGRHWTIVHHGMSEVVDDYWSPLSIGIYVSGQLTFAKYAGYVDSATDIRDFIFSYTTRPGDFALPIRLAGPNGPVGYSDSTSTYLLMNDDKWTVEDGAGNPATFQFGTSFDVVTVPANPSGRQLDYTLADAGFYVKTIGFDPAWESDSYWRMVHSGSTITDSLLPRIVADSAPTNMVLLHVWSMDDEIVHIKGGRTVEMTVGYSGGTPVVQEVQVGDILFADGQLQADFEIEGGDALHVGQYTNLVLSAYEDYSYNRLNVRQVDYVTVPVLCSEPLPPTLIVEVDTATVTAPARGEGDTYRSTAQLSVYLSQAYDRPLEVTVTPSFLNGAAASWADYVRFSKTATEVSTLPAAVLPTVTIPAGSTGKQAIFLYALRADDNTTGEGNQIIFTPSFDDAAAAAVVTETQSAGVWISAAKPEILTPANASEITAVCGDTTELTVEIADTVADLSDTTIGYRVWFKASGTAKGGFLDGYWIMRDGELVDRDTLAPLTVTYPASGDQQSQIYVVSPISGKKSDPITFTAHVAEARTATVTTVDGKNNIYNEGDLAKFKVSLSEPNDTGRELYAFLVASGNARAGMFSGNPLFVICGDTDPTTTEGLPISNNRTDTAESGIKLLDGLSEDAGGLSLTFHVVLCTTPQYNEAAVVAGYDSNYLNISVYNIEPLINRIEMNGFESEYDGYEFTTVPKGMTQKFKAIVTDKGAYDLATGFQTKWTISRNGQQRGNVTIEGNPNEDANAFTYSFTQAGAWVVKCQVKDKDMDDWSPVTYSVTFEVLDSPHVVIEAEDVYTEDTRRARINVGLDYWDGDYDGTLILRLAVGPNTAGRPNPGIFKLDQGYFKETIAGVDYYEIPLTSDEYLAVPIDIVEMDGTADARFKIEGAIVTTDELPTSETPASEYYLPMSRLVDVEDVMPVVSVTPNPIAITNLIEVAGGLSNYRINWSVRSEVENDFNFTYGRWPQAGIRITFSGCENAAEGSTIITETGSGTFTPNFGSAQGPVDVTLVIETKDGSLEPYTWHFYVRPSKFLRTTVAGPLGANSQYGAGLAGLGAGHAYVTGGATFSSSTRFSMDWNCSTSASVDGYAYGYRVGDRDNGTLNGSFDIGIDVNGNRGATVPAIYYQYTPNDGKDSFFYLWVNMTPDESGRPADAPLSNRITPEVPGRFIGGTPIKLPDETVGDGLAYQRAYAEAIFSKEFNTADNLGDINADAIPDYLAVSYRWANGTLVEFLYDDLFENHWRALDVTNPDQDFLPGVARSLQDAAIYNTAGASYAPIGNYPFDTRLEVRGFGGGLNFIDNDGRIISDAAFSDLEKLAYWSYFLEQRGEEWDELDGFDLAFWSPQPRGEKARLDPTTGDTDGDGLPDGWEYFFWYQAKVWSQATNENGVAVSLLGRPRNGQKYVFERFNPNNILRGIEIPRDEVLAHFNPCTRLANSDSADFDGDGLTDLEELVLGTNPCHWDTDGDHMCDGWEVMMALDPLFGSKTGNADGDFMAFARLDNYFAAEVEYEGGPRIGTVTGYLFDIKNELKPYRRATGEGDYAMQRAGDPYYADKETYDATGEIRKTLEPTNAAGEDNYPLYMYLDEETGKIVYTIEGDDAVEPGDGDVEPDPDADPDELEPGVVVRARVTETSLVLVRDVELQYAFFASPKMAVDEAGEPLLDEDGEPVPYTYGLPRNEEIVQNLPTFWHWGNPMLENLIPAERLPEALRVIPAGTVIRRNLNYVLVHDQVNTAFGFDPRTAWNINERGYVAARWEPPVNGLTGIPVNTEPYGDYDEYLVMRYRHDFRVGLVGDGDWDLGDIWGTMGRYTTMPTISLAKEDIEALLNEGVINEDDAEDYNVTATIAEYLAAAFAQAGSGKAARVGHGADTDGDGIPDGWELYTGYSPNAGSADIDADGDGLPYVLEYAGTDSCNAYADCNSIFQHHPGINSGWYNKFFPSNPANRDTDGDGVIDVAERDSWVGEFPNGGFVYDVGMTFIYGNPADNGATCIRGGGMNPCSVDTDMDGIPDGWERQYAGVPVDVGSRRYVGPGGGGIVIAPATFKADGLDVPGEDAAAPAADGEDADAQAANVYIAGGMDATWAGDAFTDPFAQNRSYDPRTGTNRDVDFDHDGLQNYQEYLVQTARHLRYDDSITPLMGRMLVSADFDDIRKAREAAEAGEELPDDGEPGDGEAGGDEGEGEVVDAGGYIEVDDEGEIVPDDDDDDLPMVTKFFGFVPMMQDPVLFAQACIEAGYPQEATNNFNVATWRALGYLAPPLHDWDMRVASARVGYEAILLPPLGAARYVSTDPRQADTDLDGMDDYYEMFHGLNPLLGSSNPEPSLPQMDTISYAYRYAGYYDIGYTPSAYGYTRYTPYLIGRRVRGNISALNNDWADLVDLGATAADPVLYPWVMGAGEIDADGDGLRNDSERLTANLANPQTSHTDPTPRWFTDSSSTNSYVSQYYRMTFPAVMLPYYEPSIVDGRGVPYVWSFEEDEGYDTDGDWISDGREVIQTFRAPTDPLNFDDPYRRQALYLDGNRSWVQTRDASMRTTEAVDLLRQFTVELWVRPEKTGEQTILERSAIYGYDANNKDALAIRANFRIGLTEDGNVYGMFDNDDAIESGRGEGVSCQTVIGPKLDLDAWSHVALTYDGKALLLYVNGTEHARAQSPLVPANGVTRILQDPTYVGTFPSTTYEALPAALFIGGRPRAALDVGTNVVAAGSTVLGGGTYYVDNGTNVFIGALSSYGTNAFSAATATYDAMRDDEWFQGYLAEIRIWDGARSASDIAGNYRHHMTMAEAEANRLEVYEHLMGPDADSSRNDNDGLRPLLPELLQLYDFSAMPGAVQTNYVATTPAGFLPAVAGQLTNAFAVISSEIDQSVAPEVADQLTNSPSAFFMNVGWWDACETKSTVYNDYTFVPWINNAVQHLPSMDGSVIDSFLYSTSLGGSYTFATDHDIAEYVYANGAMPYHDLALTGVDSYQRAFRLSQVAKSDPGNAALADLASRAEFIIRSNFSATGDLVPMGGAYAKTCPDMWDGNGAADAWEATGVDTDGDGLPDWWEDLYGLDKNSPDDWTKEIPFPDASSGTAIPAWEAYLRDLARGMQPDGSVNEDYASTADIDGDGLVDWWQNLFAVTGANADDDGDGLSNYVEYLLSEVFHLKGTDGKWLRFSPISAYSVNSFVSDYFYRMNQLYVGEIFTDHDRIKDQWESGYLVKSDLVSPYVYDADKDPDDDGWSNYAEFQAGTDPVKLGSLGVDAVQMDEYPVPTIELTINYSGTQNIGDAQVIVKAYRDQGLTTIPDAVWTLGVGGEGENGNIVGIQYFGMNPMHETLVHLSPGSVVPNSVKFEFKDPAWTLVDETTQQKLFNTDPATALWEGGIIDVQRSDNPAVGDIVSQGDTSVSFGTIDYATGELKLDFAAFPEYFTIVGDITEEREGETWSSVYNLQKSYVRVNWESKLITGGSGSTYYLSKANPRDGGNNSLGHVKEGLNTFIAFYDLDGDGAYTLGEPYGFVRNVDVRWNYAKARIELTDTNPVFARIDLTQAEGTAAGEGGIGGIIIGGDAAEGGGVATDREALWPTDPDVVNMLGGIAAPEGKVRVRVARYAVDNLTSGGLNAASVAVVYDRVIDTTAGVHPVLTEADILNSIGNEFDLDWAASSRDSGQIDLSTAAQNLTGKVIVDQNGNKIPCLVTNVYYTIYIGNDAIIANNPTNAGMIGRAIVRKFGPNRTLPTVVPGPATVNTPAPTFSWKDTAGDTTYTAFRIRVTGPNGFSWTSDYQLMPPRGSDGVYTWTAPLRVGSIVPGGTAEFMNETMYTWSISTYNAKYRSDQWVTGGQFYMNVLTEQPDYGTARVAVRYYGPDAVAQSGTIRVQAYLTPDFSGAPVAEGYVTSLADIASTDAITEPNATISGLKAGSYYIRAFVDTDRNGSLSFTTDVAGHAAFWESWGCYCTRDSRTGTIFIPKSVTVGPTMGASDLITVFIDDCDSDQDSLPDAWEWSQTRGLTSYGASRIDQNVGGFTMNQALTEALTADGKMMSGMSVLATTNLQSPRIAALLLGVNATGSDASVRNTLNSAGSDVVAEPLYVEVTAIALDREAGTVSVSATTEGTKKGSAAVNSEIYTIPAGADAVTLTCIVEHRDALKSGKWTTIKTQKVSIGRSSTTYTFDLGGDVDLSSGFFRARLEK